MIGGVTRQGGLPGPPDRGQILPRKRFKVG